MQKNIISFIKKYRFQFIVALVITIIYLFSSIFIPILFAFFLAYLIDPLVTFIEKLKINRTVAISLLTTFLLIFILIFMLILVPELLKQVKTLAKSIPNSSKAIENLLKDISTFLGIPSENMSGYITDFLDGVQDYIPKIIETFGKLLLKLFTNSKGILGILLNFIMVPLFLFYFLRDYNSITSHIKKLIPLRDRDEISSNLKNVDDVLKAYFSGQIIVMIFLSISYTVGLTITGIDMAFIIGVIAGFLSIIPYFGAAIGIILGLGMAILNIPQLGVWGILGVILTFSISNFIEGFFITPRVMSAKVGIEPFTVILALFIGGGMFGLGGMLFAVPVTAILKVYYQKWENNYIQSEFYNKK